MSLKVEKFLTPPFSCIINTVTTRFPCMPGFCIVNFKPGIFDRKFQSVLFRLLFNSWPFKLGSHKSALIAAALPQSVHCGTTCVTYKYIPSIMLTQINTIIYIQWVHNWYHINTCLKGDLIHRDRVMQLMNQALYHQATTAWYCLEKFVVMLWKARKLTLKKHPYQWAAIIYCWFIGAGAPLKKGHLQSDLDISHLSCPCVNTSWIVFCV